MNDYLSILLTFVNSFDQLEEIAVKVPCSDLEEDCLVYYNEPENRAKFLMLIPEERRINLRLVKVSFLSDIIVV